MSGTGPMTPPSSLRQLARDYFEGRLDRGSYQQRRRELIEEWTQANEEVGWQQTVREADVFTAAAATQTDSAALVDAFANREQHSGPSGEQPWPGNMESSFPAGEDSKREIASPAGVNPEVQDSAPASRVTPQSPQGGAVPQLPGGRRSRLLPILLILLLAALAFAGWALFPVFFPG